MEKLTGSSRAKRWVLGALLSSQVGGCALVGYDPWEVSAESVAQSPEAPSATPTGTDSQQPRDGGAGFAAGPLTLDAGLLLEQGDPLPPQDATVSMDGDTPPSPGPDTAGLVGSWPDAGMEPDPLDAGPEKAPLDATGQGDANTWPYQDAMDADAPMDAGTAGLDADTPGDGDDDDDDDDDDDSAVPTETSGSYLLHRYSFSGTGTTIWDSEGDADGAVHGGAELAGWGTLQLDGINDYVALPADLFTGLSSISIELWLRWQGGACDQVAFAFENLTSEGSSALLYSPESCASAEATADLHTPQELKLLNTSPLATDQWSHLVLTINREDQYFSLYVNGFLQRFSWNTLDAQVLQASTAFIGRTQEAATPYLAATLSELRIYSGALSSWRVWTNYLWGPNGL